MQKHMFNPSTSRNLIYFNAICLILRNIALKLGGQSNRKTDYNCVVKATERLQEST